MSDDGNTRQSPLNRGVRHEMEFGDLVLIKLHGDDRIYRGRVIRPRKMEVELPGYNHANNMNFDPCFIADENSIERWERA